MKVKFMKKIEYISVKDKRRTYRIPFYKIVGEKVGKVLMLIAGQHGTEWVGVEVIRRIFVDIDTSKLSGTILAVPVANPMAVSTGNHHFLFDQKEKKFEKHPFWFANKNCYNMNRLWPGKKNGSILERITAEIWERGVLKCDILVDFHCYSRNCPHSVYVNNKSFHLGRILNMGLIADHSARKDLRRSLMSVANKYDKLAMTIEFVGTKEIIEDEVKTGLNAINNLMKYLGMMMSGHPKIFDKQYFFKSEKVKNILIRCRHTGFIVKGKNLLEKVEKGETICEIFGLYQGKIIEKIKAPVSGVITYKKYVNLVKKGDVILAVADLQEVN